MADDVSLESFVETLRRSKLLDAAEVFRLAARSKFPSARAFADDLIRTGDLTHYQADKLLRGHWQGLVLGSFSILAPLGRGGMGTVVYLARDRRLSESLGDTVLVALKVLPQRKAVAEPRVLARFRREMELGGRVSHPNVVRTAAAGEIDDVHYLALEFVPGRTLRQLVGHRGTLPVGEAARIFADVALGLAHIHERGIVHRDIKPANVMIRPDGRAVLLDLGLAYAPGEPLPQDPAVAGGPGYVVGTMDFIAPEQGKNPVAVGPAADVYGLGCSLYFSLTGQVPFPAEGTKQKLQRHRSDPIPLIPNVPPQFASIVQTLMAKLPNSRPASAVRVRELLLPWAQDSQQNSIFDAVATADEPGLDVTLWDAAPDEELPDEVAKAVPFIQVEESSRARTENEESGVNVELAASKSTGIAMWVLAAFLVAGIFLIILIAMIRRV